MAMAGWKPQQSFNTSHVTLYRAKEWAMEHLECEFQYISCYSLSFQATPLAFHHLCFNTSHVTLYPDVLSLMLSQCSFQYISCYSLSELPPHLWRVLVPFQYISCYSLSRGTLKWAKRNKRFNTSHVTLYRRKHLSNTLQEDLFQYISCYSLSLSTPPEVKQRMSFQYISCYSLSKPHYFPNREMMCFNTSHVTLYPQEKRSRAFGENSFNTSHVTLYQSSSNLGNVRVHVSIHLMLLFIFATLSDSAVMPMFQYISCYSLSEVFKDQTAYNTGFNTSHVTLYQAFILCASLAGYCFNTSHVTLYLYFSQKSKQKSFMFQYISCYSLSGIIPIIPCTNPGFNTSHVTLYPKDRFGLVNVITFQYISCYSLS